MIFRLGAMFFTACIALVACSDEMTEENGFRENEGEMHMYGAKVALVLPSESGGGKSIMSRAGEEPDFGDGNENEYKVSKDNVRFVFLDDNHHTMSVVSGKEVKWTTEFPNTGSESGNANVTQQGTVQITADRRPAYLVVLCNVDSDVETALKGSNSAISYTTLQETLSPTTTGASTKDFWLSHVASTENGFLMTNSTYANDANAPTSTNTIKAVKVDATSIVEISQLETATPVEVYVERVVAKASLKISDTNEPQTSTGNGTYYKLNDGTEGTQHEFGVKLLGWTLNATNKSFLPLKKIEGIISDWEEMADVSLMNSTTYHRSYWAADGNYTDGTYANNSNFIGASTDSYTNWADNSLNYYTIKEASTHNTNFDGKTASYCLENTMNAETAKNKAAITHMLIVGQYVNSDGSALDEDKDVYRFEGKIYTKAQLGKYIKDHLKNLGYNVNNVPDTDFTFEVDNSTWKDRADVKITKVYYSGEEENLQKYKKGGTDDLKTSVFGWTTLWVYPNGYCYYTVPIRHFEASNKDKVGYYGMVRNHWYVVTVTLQGFGEPANPDKPVIPDDTEESDYALKAEINVLSWATKKQGSTVGGDITWD